MFHAKAVDPLSRDLVFQGCDQHAPAAHSRLKRAFDIVAATLALLFLSLSLLLVALAIKLDSRGPVFFLQRRCGLGGRAFRVFKFRTMTVLEDGDQVQQAQKGDKRVTRVGAFLRRTSIDELPQLWNVIRGDMSLVGPRPHAIAHDIEFDRQAPGYARRFRVRPGITGLAQVSGHRGEVHTLDQLRERVRLDNFYIEDWSVGLDIWILLKTVVTAPLHRNAY